MPLYDFNCESGHRFERFVPLEKFEEAQFCPCGSVAHRAISAPMFAVDHTDYTCPITGIHIGSLREHRENLARHDCRVFETGEREANERVKAAKEAEFEKALDATVERTIDSWDSAKKEQLHNELVNGKLDLEVART